MKRHFVKKHGSNFKDKMVIRKKKKKSGFRDSKDFIETVLKIAIQTNIPLRFWNNRHVRRLVGVHVSQFRTTVNARKVRKLLTARGQSNTVLIREKLQKTMFPLKFDIGSKLGKFFLGVNA